MDEFEILLKGWTGYLEEHTVPGHPDRFLAGLKVCAEQLSDAIKRTRERETDDGE
jgi:hypothetical protein